MFLAGLFYLAFEETITKGSGHSISVFGSRIIMGIQVIYTFSVNICHWLMESAVGHDTSRCDRYTFQRVIPTSQSRSSTRQSDRGMDCLG